MKKIINFFNREQNLLIHIIATILVTIFGIIFKISEKEWLVVYLLCAFVISTELVNSSIELAVDIITDKYHPAAVVTAAFTALCIGLYIFLPKIIAFF